MTEIKIPIPAQPDNFWCFRHLDEVDSTNRVVSDLAKQGLSEGQIILADHQIAGRGRLDRDWIDIPGSSVLMSVLLRPKIGAQFFFLITSALSLAALQVLEAKYSISCKLKWPNDVMVSDKKIAGVLAEAAFEGAENVWVVVGIGLNCLQSEQDLARLGRGATSIFVESGVMLDKEERVDLSKQIASKFASLYLSLEDSGGRIALASLYRNSCDTIGKLVRVEMPDDIVVGVASDISVEGNLLVQTDSCLRAIAAGDVIHLRKTS
ncbi:MAG: biotin--[acetyl-CoA-carboxylase] ligase [Acidimicrobiaceae bacterium]|nr:biotin--[acetyl-CoA-carboxylase] ligase [Acidimicrobiaceae bacterium]